MYENPDKLADQEAAYNRYLEALDEWSEQQFDKLKPEQLTDYIIDGCYNMGFKIDSELAIQALAELFDALRSADWGDQLSGDVGLAWDKLRARVRIAHERAKEREDFKSGGRRVQSV